MCACMCVQKSDFSYLISAVTPDPHPRTHRSLSLWDGRYSLPRPSSLPRPCVSCIGTITSAERTVRYSTNGGAYRALEGSASQPTVGGARIVMEATRLQLEGVIPEERSSLKMGVSLRRGGLSLKGRTIPGSVTSRCLEP